MTFKVSPGFYTLDFGDTDIRPMIAVDDSWAPGVTSWGDYVVAPYPGQLQSVTWVAWSEMLSPLLDLGFIDTTFWDHGELAWSRGLAIVNNEPDIQLHTGD